MEDVLGEIRAFLSRSGVARSERLLVAASGGADSTALALSLAALGMPIALGHVHHGMRGAAADGDAEFVERLARRLGAPFEVARVDAGRRDRRSPEHRARELRYDALEALRVGRDCAWIATAHTLDDQAETLLLRALRGTSPLGLASIRSIDPERRLLRPLLGLRRARLRAFLSGSGETWREDESNSNLTSPRNRLRAEVLPALERVQPDAAIKFARLAHQIGRWAEPRRAEIARLLAGAIEPGEGGEWLPLRALRARPAAEQGEILAAWIGSRTTYRHVEGAVELVVRGPSGRSLSLPGKRVLFRDRDALWLGPSPGPSRPDPFERWLEPPEHWSCPLRGIALGWSAIERADAMRGGWPVPAGARVLVRSAAAGDSIALEPGAPPRPLRVLFQRAAWSQRRRARALVVEHEGRVVWVPGLARATPANELRHGWLLVAGPLSTRGVCC